MIGQNSTPVFPPRSPSVTVDHVTPTSTIRDSTRGQKHGTHRPMVPGFTLGHPARVAFKRERRRLSRHQYATPRRRRGRDGARADAAFDPTDIRQPERPVVLAHRASVRHQTPRREDGRAAVSNPVQRWRSRRARVARDVDERARGRWTGEYIYDHAIEGVHRAGGVEEDVRVGVM